MKNQPWRQREHQLLGSHPLVVEEPAPPACKGKKKRNNKGENDRARARIFSSSRSCDSDDTLSQTSTDEKNSLINKDENETSKTPVVYSEQCSIGRDINSTRVAILRDREKDRSDPDYDRNYERFVLSLHYLICLTVVWVSLFDVYT